jgi:hypothetical protein
MINLINPTSKAYSNMKKSIFSLAVIAAIWTSPNIFGGGSLLPHITSDNLLSKTAVPTTCVIRDSSNFYWTIFSSDYLGFHEFWVAYSKDALNWSAPLYTGIPVLPSENYQIMVKRHQIDFDWRGDLVSQELRHYYRAIIDTTIMGYTVFKSMLYDDSDGDGLSDLAEDRLWTDPSALDTDGDDKADGFDQNPLAASAEKIDKKEQLHKRIIEFELEEFESNQLVVVEQFNNLPMEYERMAGIVLSMSPGAADAFVEFTGYGVPILTCTVKDTSNNMLKASFQFFVASDDAWGYDLVCRWSNRKKDWTDYDVFNEWVAD